MRTTSTSCDSTKAILHPWSGLLVGAAMLLGATRVIGAPIASPSSGTETVDDSGRAYRHMEEIVASPLGRFAFDLLDPDGVVVAHATLHTSREIDVSAFAEDFRRQALIDGRVVALVPVPVPLSSGDPRTELREYAQDLGTVLVMDFVQHQGVGCSRSAYSYVNRTYQSGSRWFYPGSDMIVVSAAPNQYSGANPDVRLYRRQSTNYPWSFRFAALSTNGLDTVYDSDASCGFMWYWAAEVRAVTAGYLGYTVVLFNAW